MDYYGDKKKGQKDDRTRAERFKDYWVNDGLKAFFIFLWVLGNLAAFGERYYQYCLKFQPPFADPNRGLTDEQVKLQRVHNIMNVGVCFARGAAACIKLNCAILMITVLRNVLSWLRGTFVGTYLPIDKNIVFHKYLAWSVAFFTAFHTTSHYFNFLNIFRHQDLANLEVLNLPRGVPVGQLAFLTLPGSTGHIVTLMMILMYSSALHFVRSPMFNVFWFTHHLFVPFFGLLMIHGAGGLLEPPTFYMWTSGPLLFYLIERTMRVCRGNQDTILQLAVAHPSSVIELQLKKAAFKYQPGMYLFLNCPYLAGQEWHPFTISSAPSDDHIGLHIRVAGDWTGDLMDFLNPDKQLGIVQENLLSAPDGSPIFKIDGPYGTASEEIERFKIVVLVGAGIGVTPFASVLKELRHKVEAGEAPQLLKVYFFWIGRDKNSFEWFSEVLAALERSNFNNFLEIHIYLTGNMSLGEVKDIMFGDGAQDAITGLQAPTNYGRPNWNAIFDDLAEKYVGEDVGVFLCGPQAIGKILRKNCIRCTNSRTGTKFVFHKENF